MLDKWDELWRLGGPKYSAHAKGDNRLTTPALHLGTWHLFQSFPYITGDTRQEGTEDPAIRTCLDKLSSLITEHITPVIMRQMELHTPNILPKYKRYEYLCLSTLSELTYHLCPGRMNM